MSIDERIEALTAKIALRSHESDKHDKQLEKVIVAIEKLTHIAETRGREQ